MSSIQVTLDGDGTFAGAATNIVNYTVTEDATSLNLADTQGGVGGIDFSVIEDDGFNGSIMLSGEPFTLLDPRAGVLSGIIDSGSTNNEAELSITGATALLPLVSERVVPAFSGNLSGAIQYYLSICGVTSGVQIDSSLASQVVALPSFSGEVWLQLKKLAAVYQFEIAAVADAIVIRKPRLRTVDVRKYTSTRFNFSNTEAARTVQVYYYNNVWRTNLQVYPDPATSIVDRSIISVDAGEESVTNVDAGMWIGTIDAPTHVGTLPWDNTSTTSVYSVVDKDGKMVSVQDWKNGGGSVSFALGADGKSIDITVRGMSTNSRAPYSIASSSQDMEFQYPALYIAASGVAFERKMISANTGANEATLPVNSVYVIDEPLVSTLTDAHVALSRALIAMSGVSQKFEATTTSINRRGDTGQVVYPNFTWFNGEMGSDTFTAFNADFAGYTFKTFNQWTLDNSDVADFESQAFGAIGGARVRYRNAMYRIETATSSPGSFSWTAAMDTTFQDWQNVYSPLALTFAQFNTKWAGKSFEQHARQPLYV